MPYLLHLYGTKIRFAKPKLPPESCSPAATQQVRGSGVKSNFSYFAISVLLSMTLIPAIVP